MISQNAQSEFNNVSFSYRYLDIVAKAVIVIGAICLIAGIIVTIIGMYNSGSYKV